MSASFDINRFTESIFRIASPAEFNGLALELFQYQIQQNPVYADYAKLIWRDLLKVTDTGKIPYLPIGFFKTQEVISGNAIPGKIFRSSGTSGMVPSLHYIHDPGLYNRSFLNTFRLFYGDPASYRFFGLLPSYLERKGSSLVYMVDELMQEGGYRESGFHLHDHGLLAEKLDLMNHTGVPAILFGVSFALLDFSEEYSFPLKDNIIIMETGGMKGRREEITREELHAKLCKRFHKKAIHSEYGMTELLTQAYSKIGGRFHAPPWMKVMIRDIQDPFSFLPAGRSGAINIIDLANVHSCAFIETQDIGRLHEDGSFEVLGRTDASDVRGCSLLIS